MGGDGTPPKPSSPTMEQIDAGYRQVLPGIPKWSLGLKPAMVIGGPVPSWQASIPGPKYAYSTDIIKERQPVYTMREKPAMVIGGNVPSWTNSIPGPKYAYNTDVIKPRQPVFTMCGRGPEPKEEKKKDSGPLPSGPTMEQIAAGYRLTCPRSPEVSIKSRQEMVIGGPVPSWVKSIPGPKYMYSTDVIKKRAPVAMISAKLPSESDLMKSRSPGPQRYDGAAIDAKKQELVDSTKKRSFSCSFGVGSRWEGVTARMATQGSLARFDKPC